MATANISIFDDLVNMGLRTRIFAYIMNSAFRIGWADISYGPKSAYKFLHSPFSKEELISSGLGDIIFSAPEIAPFIEGKEMNKCIVNLTQAGDVQFTHTHAAEEVVVLYYANLEWLPEWWGETMFYNDNQSSIVHASRYTPGRFVVFDGNIPHTIRPQSTIGPQYRFTVTAIFTESKEKEIT
jgi:SM-20-related protein